VAVRGTLDVRDDVDDGWSVEWAIPFAALGTSAPAPGERWRANFYRIDRANGGELSAWAPTHAEPPEFHLPDRFGVLELE
jgi:Carbohydrate-binding family 9